MHNRFAAPARRDLHRISKALGKNWRHSESFDTKKLPPSLWSVKETKTPSEAPFKLFEGVPFFLSFYLIEISPSSIKNRGDAHQHSFATSKCLFGTDSISSGSEEDTLLCDILCSVTRTRCFVTKTPCSVGKALLSGTEKLSPLFVEVQQVEDGSVFLDGAFSFRSTFLVARWLQGSVLPKSGALFRRGSYCSGAL